MPLRQFKVKYTVNGRGAESVVSAMSAFDARQLIEAQYPGSRVIIYNVTQI